MYSANACCAGVFTANTTNWCTFLNSSVSFTGAEQYPTFQPVVWNVFPNEDITNAFCESSSDSEILTCLIPSNIICSYTSSLIMNNFLSLTTSSNLWRSSIEITLPVGLCGELSIINLVLMVSESLTLCQSKEKFFLSSGIYIGIPPFILTTGAYESYAGSNSITSSFGLTTDVIAVKSASVAPEVIVISFSGLYFLE